MAESLWYHASPHDLPTGTLLQPGAGTSTWTNTMYANNPADAAERQKWVWVDVDPMIWAGAERPFVYEVQPVDAPRPWYPDDPEEGWVTTSAVIVAVVSRDGCASPI